MRSERSPRDKLSDAYATDPDSFDLYPNWTEQSNLDAKRIDCTQVYPMTDDENDALHFEAAVTGANRYYGFPTPVGIVRLEACTLLEAMSEVDRRYPIVAEAVRLHKERRTLADNLEKAETSIVRHRQEGERLIRYRDNLDAQIDALDAKIALLDGRAPPTD